MGIGKSRADWVKCPATVERKVIQSNQALEATPGSSSNVRQKNSCTFRLLSFLWLCHGCQAGRRRAGLGPEVAFSSRPGKRHPRPLRDGGPPRLLAELSSEPNQAPRP